MIKPPITRAEAKDYGYGRFYSKSYSANFCAAEVQDEVRWHSYQCTRKPGHGPDKLFCMQHAKMVARDYPELTKK